MVINVIVARDLLKFIDKTEIHVRAGKGGAGMMSFRRDAQRPKMGPDGGNGGNGGSVYLVGEDGLNTLSRLRFKQLYAAEDGTKGGTNDCTGRCGKDLEIRVPFGTIALDRDTQEVLAEVLEPEVRYLVAKGGKRGYGNIHFAKATRQAPQICLSGTKGEHKTLSMELKVLADVGLAGFPNAGKSTLLSVMSNARPKIADYPFTTLTPQLGVVDVGDSQSEDLKSFVCADIPGLIEGASEGRGLGISFLKHLERTRVIAYVIEVCGDLSPQEAYKRLKKELEAFDEDLAGKPSLIVLSKMDAIDEDFDKLELEEYFKGLGIEILFVSAFHPELIASLKLKLLELVTENGEVAVCDPLPSLPNSREIEQQTYPRELIWEPVNRVSDSQYL